VPLADLLNLAAPPRLLLAAATGGGVARGG
jgi:hypothetical protein